MRTFFLLITTLLGLSVAAQAQTIDRIRESSELKIGFRTDAAPLSFANEDGNATGYTPLLCVGIARAMSDALEIENLNVQFLPVSAEDRFRKVADGEIDLLCGAATITLGRRELVDFSDPVFVDGSVVLLHRNAEPSFDALDGKRIGVRAATTTSSALANSITKAGITAETIEFDDHSVGIDALKDGEIDAYFGDQTILTYYLLEKELGSDLRLTRKLLTVEKQGLALARGDADFKLLVDAILSTMYRNGAMQRVYRETLPGLEPGAATRALHMIAPTLP